MTKLVPGGVYQLDDRREVRLLEQPTERSVRLLEQKSDGIFNRAVGSPFELPLEGFSSLNPKLLYTIYVSQLDTQP